MIYETIIYETIINKKNNKQKQLAVLIDPDKINNKYKLSKFIEIANESNTDLIFVGGSLVSNSIDNIISTIKENSTIPVVLFPGSVFQISDNADAILLLSLISGRNPEYLIGNHVIAAPFLAKSNLEIISTAYILIGGGNMTSVEYVSNTKPIPPNKYDIAVATALAGQMIGYKMVYIDAGSGASNAISEKMISEVKKTINLPLIVGGGLRNENDINKAYNAGADIIVLGNVLEENPDLMKRIKR